MPNTTVRDKLWLWGHEAGSHNTHYKLPAPSRMTPVEGACYMGLHNLLMIVLGNKPEPPFDIHARAMIPMKRVVWSIVGDGSSTRNNEMPDLDAVIELSKKFPNLVGGMMDDFFQPAPNLARWSPEALAGFRTALHGAARPLDLWVVVYNHDLTRPIQPYLEHCDVLNFWTWKAKDLVDLESNFARLESLAPKHRKVLGCYLFDYGDNQPMPLEIMQRQCRIGLQWLKQGRIDGMIFLASCICDLELDTVEWARQWIAEVGDQPVSK